MSFYVKIDGVQIGPLSEHDFHSYASSGKLKPTDTFLSPSMTEWASGVEAASFINESPNKEHVPEQKNLNKQVPEQKDLLENLWEGNLGLVTTYWVYGVLGGIVWGVSIAALKPDPEGDLVKLVWLLFACYYFVVYVGTWQAANKFVGNKAWAILAKFAIIVVVLPVAIHLLKWLSEQ